MSRRIQSENIGFEIKMLLKLIEKYKSVKADYLNRSPRGKWLFIRNIGISVLTLTGVPVLDPHFEVYWYSFAAGIAAINILLSFLYTLWYYSETPLKRILFTPLLGTFIPVDQSTFYFFR